MHELYFVKHRPYIKLPDIADADLPISSDSELHQDRAMCI